LLRAIRLLYFLWAVRTVRLHLDGLDVLEAPFVDRQEQCRDWRAEVFGVDEVLDGADCGDSSVCRNLRLVGGTVTTSPWKKREFHGPQVIGPGFARAHAPPVAPAIHFPDRARLAA
jgi:hypothetical protein